MPISNHDFDLRELFRVLWNGKFIIIPITALFTVVSIYLALSAQELWSSKAKIEESQPQDVAAYEQQVKQFQPIFNVYQDDGTVLISKELNKLVDPELLFERFVSTYSSANNKRAFLDSSAEFQEFKGATLVDKAEMTEDITRRLYSEWFDRISESSSNEKGQSLSYAVSFQTPTRKSSFDLLTAYILFTETKVHQDAFNNLNAVVNAKRNELMQQKRILENQAKNQLLTEIERTKYAMEIARAAGVETPILTGNYNELFGIELGSKGLKAKIRALESIKSLGVIEPRLQQINAKLDMLHDLKIDRSVEFNTFRFIESVEQPITRDKPKRALLVVLGTLLGGLFGLAIVLIRFVFRKKD
nr:Wzz/FepE/Etk N-terminal domain-containing protein [Vibrio sp. L5-1]